ncbi:MAG: DNA-directed RNA polymerase subunit omega [Lachnospiraceae bacterium]|nr:DNA-directed RNA polymerase subunit omega [Lachnospiraceae bacterium]
MIHPSYVDLMEVVNKGVEEGETPVINSRYSIVMATAKRARQIVNGDEPMVETDPAEKPLSIAVRELNEGQISILAEGEMPEEEEEAVFMEDAADEELTDILDEDEAEEIEDEAEVTDEAEEFEEAGDEVE